ncbi:MAG: glycosyltransferase N-terminal domain-containing protein [Elusimicrobiota bacterium]
MYLLYNLLVLGIIAASLPYVLYRVTRRATRQQWLERLGFVSPEGAGSPGCPAGGHAKKSIWVHAASVGEIKLAVLFIRRLVGTLGDKISDFNILMSTVTPDGYNVAKSSAAAEGLPVKKIFFLPVDFYPFMRRAVKRIRPGILVLVETELWPNLILCADRAGARVVLINGRISDGSFRAFRSFRNFLKNILSGVDLFLMREASDVDKLIYLGVEPSRVVPAGNMKYDLTFQKKDVSVPKKYFGFSEDDRIFVAGSIREGEEKFLVDAFTGLKKKFSGLKFIIAPRHLNRAGFIKKLIDSAKILPGEYFIINAFGELIKAYSVADVVFVGGSLVPAGGQNVLEPALLEKPVIFGTHMGNFREPAGILKRSGGGIEVRDTAELVEKAGHLLSDPGFAKQCGINAGVAAAALSGVTDRNIESIKKFLYE